MNIVSNIENYSFKLILDKAIDFCHKHFDQSANRVRVLSLLDRLQQLNKNYGHNHPSMPNLLDLIGKIFYDANLSVFSILFFLEQLRIEIYYLGPQHLGLAPTINRIGEIYMKNDQFSEAEECFSQVFLILKNNNTKGCLYALALYNTGLIKYYNSLYVEAFNIFKVAIKEQRVALGSYHPEVAKMCLHIGDIQARSGKLAAAMNNYLESLMIIRGVHGNMHCIVYKLLYKIGCIHQKQDECAEALNAFNQALHIIKNTHHTEDMLIIVILHKIGLIYQCLGDINNTITMFQEIIRILKSKVGDKHICIASVLGLLNNIYKECGMINDSKMVSEEMQAIFNIASRQPNTNRNSDFTDSMIKIFGYVIDYSPRAAAAA